MSNVELEQRVAALEMQYAQLIEMLRDKPDRNAWRNRGGNVCR